MSICRDELTIIAHRKSVVIVVISAGIAAFEGLVVGDVVDGAGLRARVGVGVVWHELELVDDIVHLGYTGLHVVDDRDGDIEPVVRERRVDVGQRGAGPLVRREVDVVVGVEVAV